MIALSIVIILLSLAFVPAMTTVGGPQGARAQDPMGVDWLDGNGYNYLFYSFNLWGDPLSGTRVNVLITEGGVNYTASATTNSSGYAQVLVKAPAVSDYSGFQQISIKMGNGEETASGGLGIWEAGKVNWASLGGGPTALILDRSNSSKISVLVLWAGTGGSKPSGFGAYYEMVLGPPQYPNDTSGMTRLGTLDDYRSVFPIVVPANASQAASLLVDVAEPNGTVASISFFDPYELVSASSVNPNSVLYTYVTTVPNLFIPLLAIIAAYSSFGKDRVSGVIESVLARPVSGGVWPSQGTYQQSWR